MFVDNLGNKIQSAISSLSGKGKVKTKDLEEVVSKVKQSLLEADVHYQVTQQFVDSVSKALVGQKIEGPLGVEKRFLGILHNELKSLLGDPAELDLSRVLLCGLQGSGKTTTAAKLALHQKKAGKASMLIPADMQRPAAIEQLRRLAATNELDCFPTESGKKAHKVCKLAMREAFREQPPKPVIVDSAGRLHVDDELMEELKRISKIVQPTATLLVLDAMVGQEALSVTKAFAEKIPINAVILTKVDGDARGGAALSLRAATGIPIAFLGTGESANHLELFEAERLCSRILGMGDLSGLAELAEAAVDKVPEMNIEDVANFEDFNLEAFRAQLKLLGGFGPMSQVLSMIPGGAKLAGGVDSDQVAGQTKTMLAIMDSMTKQERQSPKLLNGSRRKRIAMGSGTRVQDINRLMKQFEQMRKMMKKFGQSGLNANMLNAGMLPRKLKKVLRRS